MGPSVGTGEGDVVDKCRIYNIAQKFASTSPLYMLRV